MKCTCPHCKKQLAIERKNLRSLKFPRFKCPSCNKDIGIKPSKGRCGKCKMLFHYFDFMFNESNGVAKCPSCNTANRLIIKY